MDGPVGGKAGDADRPLQLLQQAFGYTQFRRGQREVIEAVLSGRPTLAVMPTGAGKSLCYQLPALLLEGVTIVVSPLIALMKDQVDALTARGIAAACIHSGQSEQERHASVQGMADGTLRLVYVAPERFRSPGFLSQLQRAPLALLAIDEAHCISQWGHDFRPEYARLGEIRALVKAPRTVALTATATPAVQADITKALRMKDPKVFVAGFDRPNLFLEVVRVSSDKQKAQAVGKLAAKGGSGIVYAPTRRGAEKLALALKEGGRAALCYHAGLGEQQRERAQDAFMSSSAATLVATSAFGMGIDKSDVRFVVHAGIPRSLESYYQEAGRAGRDGAPAQAVLLFNHADVFHQQRMIGAAHPDESVLRTLWDFVRRTPIVEASQQKIAAALGLAEPVVFAALRLLEQAGHLERGAQGDGSAGISLRVALQGVTLPDRARAQRAALGAISQVAREGEMRELFLDDLAARAKLTGPTLRRALAALTDAGIIAYRPPFGGRAIRVLEPALPSELLRVNIPLVRWSEKRDLSLLAAMTAYAYGRSCRRRQLLGYFGEQAPFRCLGCDVCRGPTLVLEKPVRPKKVRAKGPPKPSETREATFTLFGAGRTVDQIASQRGLSSETIRNHLADLLEQGREIDVRRVVPLERRELIEEILEARPPTLLALKRALPPDFLFGEIRVVVAARKRARRAAERPQAPVQPEELGAER